VHESHFGPDGEKNVIVSGNMSSSHLNECKYYVKSRATIGNLHAIPNHRSGRILPYLGENDVKKMR